ncbi:MAG TPA: T9SS type A sorting domain-containing protein [Ignavibacteriales bacterium]|nr:T9SS type A sorting domain-containing protein [Ignavibacteriales bacterium]
MRFYTWRNLMIIILLLFAASSYAQRGHFRSDSLNTVTVTGKVMTDSVVKPTSIYSLDVDGDSTADYILYFGPVWYHPDSSVSLAKRPVNGQTVTITGGLSKRTIMNNAKALIVYEIDGAFWRDPNESAWNNLKDNDHFGDHMKDSCRGNAFGFMHDSLKSVTLKGRILVDTTLLYNLYYIDVTKDQKPDYFLNLGPFWYQPPAGQQWPKDMDSVTITGGLLPKSAMKMVIVYTINGQLWRDSTLVRRGLRGGWVHKSDTLTKFTSPFDSSTWMQMGADWNNGGMMGGGMKMPDSLYGQIIEVLPGSVPSGGKNKVLAAYEVGFFNYNGTNLLRGMTGCGGHITFGSPVMMQLHFTNNQLKGGNYDLKTVKAQYWNSTTNSWTPVDNGTLDSATNTISFSQPIASSYIILTAEQTATAVELVRDFTPSSYSLVQNYPNPFNPSTFITYEIPKAGMVTLRVYDILGRQVAQLVNESQNAGKYSVTFNAADLPSGIYIYELRANDFQMSKKMTLLK